MMPLLGILIIFTPVCRSSNSFRQTICGTSPLLCTETIKGASQSICNSRTPLMSVDTYSSGILALMKMVMGSPSLIGSYNSDTSSPFSTAFTVNILSKLNLSLMGKGLTLVLILIIWNSLRCASSKQSINSAMSVSCLKEDAKMGYLQKLILFLSTLRHSLVWNTVKVLRMPIFYFDLSFIYLCIIIQISTPNMIYWE